MLYQLSYVNLLKPWFFQASNLSNCLNWKFTAMIILQLEITCSQVLLWLTAKNETDAVVIQYDSSTVVTFNPGSVCSFLGHLTLKVGRYCTFTLFILKNQCAAVKMKNTGMTKTIQKLVHCLFSLVWLIYKAKSISWIFLWVPCILTTCHPFRTLRKQSFNIILQLSFIYLVIIVIGPSGVQFRK